MRLCWPALLALGVAAQSASAGTYTWVGASAGWATAANWAGSHAPTTTDPSTVLIFNTASGTTSTNNVGAYQFNGFDFEGTAINTTTITASNGAFNFVANSGTNPSITQNSSENYLLQGTGGITLSNDLTFKGTGSGVVTSAAIISGTGALIVNSSAPLVLTAVNTYSGGTVMNSGLLRLGFTTTKPIGTGTLTFNGGRISSNASGTTSTSIVSNAIVSGTGSTITFGDTTNNAALTFSGSTTLSVGTTLIATSNVKFTGPMSLGSNVTFSATNNATLTLSNLDVSNNVTLNLTVGQTPLAVTGTLSDTNLTGKLSFVLSGGTTSTPYTLVNFGSAAGSFTYSDLNLVSSDYALDPTFGTGGWKINGTSLQVQFIPEPSAVALCGLGIGAVAWTTMRRRKLSTLP